jgi:multidrug efflux pump subunit AcrA (membrane-fusion protein)
MKLQSMLEEVKRRPFITGLVLVIITFLILSAFRQSVDEVISDPIIKTARVATSQSLASNSSIDLIGNIRAMSGVNLTADRSGRVVRVNTTLGASVAPGQVIIELENASERAALLQAEGFYESAQAQAAVSDIGLNEAESKLRTSVIAANNVVESTFTTINDVVRNTIDKLFSSPNSNQPGLRLDARSDVLFLNQERLAFAALLTEPNLSSSDPEETMTSLTKLTQDIDRILRFIDTVTPILADPRSLNTFSQSEISLLQSQFSAARAQLVGVRGSLNNAIAGIESDLDGLRRAQTLSQNGTVSQASAQLKQALGSLRAAQANYEKTLLRTPIGGRVNKIDVQVGDFVNAFSSLADVANNTQLEIVTYVSDSQRELISVGMPVQVNSDTAIVTAISPAVDSVTRRIEVRLSVAGTNLRIGETVRLQLTSATTSTNQSVRVPLTAVRVNGAEASVLQVVDDEVVKRLITLGTIRGNSVEIISGLESSDEFIVDARPFRVGDVVNVSR